ncbi:MAG: long-chain fatty acid--CoA ligase [Actinobacteria bacterium]|nr:long-chain fatty acid--CoA ligase [Actinomycetota bacterium]
MAATVLQMFLDRTRASSGGVAFRHKVEAEWKTITWGAYEKLVRRAGAGLRALGLDAKQQGAILSGNRWEWHVADIAIEACGGVTVPIYPTSAKPQVTYIAKHSESRVVFVENAEQLARVDRHELPDLMKVIVFDPASVEQTGDVITWDALLTLGDEFARANPTDLDEHIAAIEPDQLATIVYTSGTSGPPKGAMLTHANITWTVESLNNVLTFGVEDRRLSFLPLSHIAERTTSHFLGIHQGTETWFATSIDTLRQDLIDCKPSQIFAVPRVWEKFYAGIMGLIENLPAEQREAAEQAIQLGYKRVEAMQAGTSLPPELEAKYQEADGKLFALARAALGLDQCRALVSGGAPISPEILRFFHAIGLPIAEVYGQTEDCGPTTINRYDNIKIGTVGQALNGVEVRIAEDGEILVRGGNVTPGYFKEPEATKEFLDGGWMHTGDVGELDDEGFLRITDRKKDLIITASGKNVAPQVIENMLKYSPWISQAVVIGDRRPYLVALLTLDLEAVAAFAKQKSIAFGDPAELVRHPDVLQLVDTAVAEVNEQVARIEQVKRWTVLDRDFLQDEGEITPTLKVKRRAIIDRYGDQIEELYA